MKKLPVEIGVSEWMDELAKHGRKNDAGRTAQELAELSGFSVKRTLVLLGLAKKQGRLLLGFRTAERLDGRPMSMPVYTITRPKKANK